MIVYPRIAGRLRLSFVVAANNRRVLERNLLASPCIQGPDGHEVIIQEGFASAAAAYNSGMAKASNGLVVFCHQDIFLPKHWVLDLEIALQRLARTDPNWGVLGCYGETLNDGGRGCIYASGRGIMGTSFQNPEPVQTLDEIVLILRKGSGLRFDDDLPHFHLYGTDICLRARQEGLTTYAIPAFCIHNTQEIAILPPEFYECCQHIRRVWREYLPVRTTCIRLTKAGFSLHWRRLHGMYLRHVRRKHALPTRVDNVESLLREMAALPSRHQSDRHGHPDNG